MMGEKQGKESIESNDSRYILTERDSTYTIISILILFLLNTAIEAILSVFS